MRKVFISLAVLFILVLPVFVLAQGGTNDPPPGGTNPLSIPNPLINDGIDTIAEFLELVISKIILPVGSVVVVIVFIYAGFLFVTSQGDVSKLATAKSTFWWAVIGTAILLGALVISSVIKETVCQIAENTPGC